MEHANSELLSLLYKSTLEEGFLQPFLNKLASMTDTHNVGFLSQDFRRPERSRMVSNLGGEETNNFYAGYAGNNMFLEAAIPYLSSGTVIRTNTKLNDMEFRRSQFYSDFCQKADIYNSMGATIRVDDERLVGLTFNRQESAPFSKLDQHWAESLMPHLQTYLAIRQKFISWNQWLRPVGKFSTTNHLGSLCWMKRGRRYLPTGLLSP